MAAVAVSSPKSTIFQNPISLREPSSSLFGGSLKGFCFQVKPRSKSRKAINLVVAATNSTISGSRGGGDRFYINFTEFPFPLGPFLNRSLELRQPPDCISKESLLASAVNGLAVKLISKGKEVSQEPVVDNKLNRQKGLEFHFAAPINASRSDLLAAFAFLDDLLDERYVTRPSLSLLFTSLLGKAASYFPPDDMQALSSLGQFLVSIGAVKKTVCLGYKGSLAKRKDSLLGQSVSRMEMIEVPRRRDSLPSHSLPSLPLPKSPSLLSPKSQTLSVSPLEFKDPPILSQSDSDKLSPLRAPPLIPPHL
ncbi:hypothetical protein C1H46_019100 [Malus baccata]|uniref:Uncharacterized protein n=1 Tax=Malus baccata TaxID=106549 RepID=A0A540M9E0_MALBA|nr:hypothetical protein C1H46_019100 [Malus baccata]